MYASLHINDCLLVFYIHGIEHLNEDFRLMFEHACSGREQAPEWFLARSEQRKGRGLSWLSTVDAAHDTFQQA